MIRDEILELVAQALAAAQEAGDLPAFAAPEITVEHPQRPEHGDYSANLPMRIQGLAKMKAIEVAEALLAHVPQHAAVSEVRVAPPGFLNFYLDGGWAAGQAAVIAAAGKRFATTAAGSGQRVQIEYVSANPTGPIHVGNGRGAAIGSTLAKVLRSQGYEVDEEYYINDGGSQVAIFGRTLYARYQQLFGRDAEVPENGYPGQYMVTVAERIREDHGERFLRPEGEEGPPELGDLGIEMMIEGIREDLAAMGVEYATWFSERSLQVEGGPYTTVLELLRGRGYVVERDGAVWFTSSELGESKDNVLIRSDGQPTYYATDIAYHYNKFIERRYDRVIDIWGADHQGHVSRVKAGVQAIADILDEGPTAERLDVLLYQLVTLRRGDEIVPLSKRAGEIVTLREVLEEVGVDATRFFFLSPSANQTMDFDLDLAKSQSDENPVYYVQYAHARIAGIIVKATERGLSSEDADDSLLTHDAEQALIRKLLLLPEVVEKVAATLEVHHLPHYSLELATAFHSFYTQCLVIDEGNEPLTRARLLLLDATRAVLANTLGLMGVSAPDQM